MAGRQVARNGACIDRVRPLAYKLQMRFEWDEAKSNAYLKGRGFDFTYASRVFLDPNRIVERDRRRDYGEDKFQVLGVIEDRVYAVAFTMRDTATRMISARKANAREIEYYEHRAHQS